MAGLATTAFALKNGIKDVTLIEKNSRIGGSLRYAAGGFVAADSKVMKENGYDDSLDRVVKWVHAENDGETRNGIDENFVEYLLSETGKTLDQMIEMTNSKVTSVLPDPYLRVTYARNGADTAEKLAKYIRDNGGKIIVDTQLTDLITDGDSATGAKFENATGSFEVKANNVVVTTGGTSYEHEELMDRFTPEVANVHIHNEANHANTGDGYDALIKVGAAADGEDVYKNGFIMMGDDFNLAIWPTLYEKAILLNKDAKRFTNEKPFDYGNITTKMYEEGSSAYYLIFDTDLLDEKFKQVLDSNPRSFRKVAEADNLETLAQELGINANNLKETVASYNRITKTGRDPFGKEPESLAPLTGKHGYYGVYVRPGSWGTMGGVRINQKMQVLLPDDTHFNHLYAAGETSTGDLFAEYYMGAFSLGYYATEGRLIAEELA